MPARVSGNQVGVITTGGNKILPYDMVGISSISCPLPALGEGGAFAPGEGIPEPFAAPVFFLRGGCS